MLVWLDDLRLNAELSGPKDAPPLVLIQGLGLDLALWDALLPHLPTRTLRLDLRGQGASDTPPANFGSAPATPPARPPASRHPATSCEGHRTACEGHRTACEGPAIAIETLPPAANAARIRSHPRHRRALRYACALYLRLCRALNGLEACRRYPHV